MWGVEAMKKVKLIQVLEIHNHFAAGSNCQVFNGPISGCVFAMPGSTVTQQATAAAPLQADEQPDVSMLTGCAVDIRVAGLDQAVRYAAILLDISTQWGEPFDEIIIERNARGSFLLHFAVRPKGNRRKMNYNIKPPAPC